MLFESVLPLTDYTLSSLEFNLPQTRNFLMSREANYYKSFLSENISVREVEHSSPELKKGFEKLPIA